MGLGVVAPLVTKPAIKFGVVAVVYLSTIAVRMGSRLARKWRWRRNLKKRETHTIKKAHSNDSQSVTSPSSSSTRVRRRHCDFEDEPRKKTRRELFEEMWADELKKCPNEEFNLPRQSENEGKGRLWTERKKEIFAVLLLLGTVFTFYNSLQNEIGTSIKQGNQERDQRHEFIAKDSKMIKDSASDLQQIAKQPPDEIQKSKTEEIQDGE